MPNSLLYLASSLIWGSTWLAITFQFGTVPVTASVGYRFIVAGTLLLGWCLLRGERLRLSPSEFAWSMAQGVMMFMLSYMLVYEGERHITSGLVAVLNSSMVIFNLLGMRLFFGKQLERRSVVGGALGLIGIVLVFLPEVAAVRGDRNVLWGAALSIMAAVIASGGNMVAQRNRNHGLPMLPSICVGMLTGGISAIIVTLISGDTLVLDLRPSYLASLLYLAVLGSIVAFSCYLTLLGRIGAGKAVYVSIAVPILALVFSGFFEGFRWQINTVIGIILAMVGNIVMMGDPVLLQRLNLFRPIDSRNAG